MNYKDYKRQLVSSEALNKPLEERYLYIYSFIDDTFSNLDRFGDEDMYPGSEFYFNKSYMFHVQNSILYISHGMVDKFKYEIRTFQEEALKFIYGSVINYLGITCDEVDILLDFQYRKYNIYFKEKHKHDNSVRNNIIWH